MATSEDLRNDILKATEEQQRLEAEVERIQGDLEKTQTAANEAASEASQSIQGLETQLTTLAPRDKFVDAIILDVIL